MTEYGEQCHVRKRSHFFKHFYIKYYISETIVLYANYLAYVVNIYLSRYTKRDTFRYMKTKLYNLSETQLRATTI